ncbi:GTP cyclohydrolase II [Indioceanicola profundi]|uniref:GTP cyclohydrolase II n=1 Tax=Indioceanicola profundi TaxID=2220096 RepID=UPI00298E20A4|nr:GTP cyclohydrolase II [Indioceanicola profundi]
MTAPIGSTNMALDILPADLNRPLDRAAQRAVDRALSELRRAETVVLGTADGCTLLVQAAESATAPGLSALQVLGGQSPVLAISGQRALALGLQVAESSTVLLRPGTALAPDLARTLADPTHQPARPRAAALPPAEELPPGSTPEGAALLLVKLARMLPAAIVAEVPRAGDAALFARKHDLLPVRQEDILAYRDQTARTLYRVAEATVPLEDAERTRILAFRPSDGGPEHLAIVIGEPKPGEPVLTRLHSECFTGDLLGSLRCDCGPQLRGAIKEIAEAGAGVLLYLAQEGRGIGLVNKLRAYRLQDGGLDTVDANTALGFDADERVYFPAASMLKSLGFKAVRLLTNNPDKMAQLAKCGVQVVDRVPHIFPSNGHNEAYLRTKAEKSGHMF